jgi:phenylacetic acid degradation protein
MPYYAFKDKKPRVHPTAYVHPLAVLLGDVEIGEGCYIGPGAILRGDWGRIRVGRLSNVQENCVFHAGPDASVQMGDECHVSHGAIIHGATLEERVHIGMGAILFDGVHVGRESVVGAGSVLLGGFKVPPRMRVAGVPARILGEVSEELARSNRLGAALYQGLPALYRDHLREITPEDALTSWES